MADNLRHLGGRRGVAAALGADDAVDDGHADAREVAELHAVEEVLAGGMLRLAHDDEIRRAPDFDDAAVQRAHPRGVAGGEAERDFQPAPRRATTTATPCAEFPAAARASPMRLM